MQLGCRAHVRRKFDEVSKAQGKNLGTTNTFSLQVLVTIKKLFLMESDIKHLSPEQSKNIGKKNKCQYLRTYKPVDQALTQVTTSSLTGNALASLAKR
jgi:Transposase IS66 family